MPLEHLLERRDELLKLPEIQTSVVVLEMILASYACKYFWLKASGVSTWKEYVKTFSEEVSPEDYSKITRYGNWLSALPFPVDAAYFYAWAHPKITSILTKPAREKLIID